MSSAAPTTTNLKRLVSEGQRHFKQKVNDDHPSSGSRRRSSDVHAGCGSLGERRGNLSGRRQHLSGVLEVTHYPGPRDADGPIILEDSGNRLLGRRNRQGLFGLIHLAQTPSRSLIVFEKHQLDGGDIVPCADRVIHAQHDGGVPGRRFLLRPGGLDLPPTGIWRSSADGAPAGDEQSTEIPLAGLHVR